MKGIRNACACISLNAIRHFSSSLRRSAKISGEAEKIPTYDYKPSKKQYNRIFACGNVQSGALGVPFSHSSENPEKEQYFRAPRRLTFGERFEVTSVAAGFGFSLFTVNSDTNHKVYGTGVNTDSQLGYHAVRENHPLEILFVPQPINLPLINSSTKIMKISAGRAHSIILTEEEGIFTLGNNAYGQCGRKIIANENYLMSNFIHHIKDIEGKKIKDIECGQDHSFAVTEDGSVYSCGWGADGQTGLEHYKNTERFTRVCGDIKGEEIKKISSRADFVLAISEEGDVFGWGNIEYGQMMVSGGNQQLSVPTNLNQMNSKGKFIDVGTTRSACIAVNENGEVFTWGHGLLGVGPETVHSLKPVKIPETLFGRNDFQPDNKVMKVRSGMNHMMAITSVGDLYSWGRNKSCCLGLGIEKDQYFPLKISVGGLVKDVACGVDHTIILCKPFI